MENRNPGHPILALLAALCAITCLGLAQVSRSHRAMAAAPTLVSPVPLDSIPTDRYLDLGAPASRAASDDAYTPAGPSWSRDEGPAEPWAPARSEHRYEDLGR